MGSTTQAAEAPPPDVKGNFRSHPAPVRPNNDFFRVELLLPDGTVLQPCAEASDTCAPPQWRQHTYVLPAGMEFEMRYVLRKPTEVRYGGSVFVDQGNGEPEAHGAAACEANHQFVFSAGATSFHDRGYFEGTGVSRRFTAAPAVEAAHADADLETAAQRLEAARRLGWIRVCFARVLSAKPVAGESAPAHATTQLLPRGETQGEQVKLSQFACVTAPGKRVRDDVEEVDATLADTAFEWRLEFKHFASLSRSHVNLRAFSGLPLPLLEEQRDVRLRLIELTVNDLQIATRTGGVAQDVDATTAAPPPAFVDNPPVTVSDVVHHLSRNVSPAASYFACVGAFKPGRCARPPASPAPAPAPAPARARALTLVQYDLCPPLPLGDQGTASA
jgi:hypothetical protein